ncbi:MAG: N-acetyltransferase [Planctomycetota bacterium]|nr:N-acetyltransferase [Planctomycetota bacterium]
MDVILRPAEPSFEDGLAFAHHFEVASDGLYRVLLGGGSDRIVARAFRSPDHELSFENVTFAERSGVIVAMVSSFDARAKQQFSDQPLERAAGRWRMARLATVVGLGAGLFAFMDRVAAEDHYLQAISVDPSQRGAGVGAMLIGQVEARARAQRCAGLTLHVAEKNEGARRLYERLGFEVEATSPRYLWLPGTSALRMNKSLA